MEWKRENRFRLPPYSHAEISRRQQSLQRGARPTLTAKLGLILKSKVVVTVKSKIISASA